MVGSKYVCDTIQKKQNKNDTFFSLIEINHVEYLKWICVNIATRYDEVVPNLVQLGAGSVRQRGCE